MLFPGDARSLPEAPSSRGVLGFGYTFRTADRRPPEPVRHAAGYEAFAAFASAAGTDPAGLADDLGTLVAFVAAHRGALADPALAGSAAVFLGNVIAVLHPRATWRSTPEAEIGTDAVSMPVMRAIESIRDDPRFAARMASGLLAHWREEDERHDATEAAMAAARSASEAAVLADEPDLVLPPTAAGPLLDDDGAPIPFGRRWPDGPPDDAYSRVTHPERFAPLVEAAEAIAEQLERRFDVEVVRSTGDPRRVTLRPSRGAPIRIEITRFPAVRLRAGLLLDETVPSCGCDACDETAASAIETLVGTVLGVVAGGLAETLPGPQGPGALSLRRADGDSWQSGGTALPEQADRLVQPEALAALDGAAWPAWPRRP